MTPYTIKSERDDEGYISYVMTLPSKTEPVADIYKVEVGSSIFWRGSVHVENSKKEEFDIAVVGRTLRSTAKSLYLAMKSIVKES